MRIIEGLPDLELDTQYSIGELSDAASVTARTIRYYVSEGLLSPPEKGGRGASYNDEHLARLRLIRRLKGEYLPLQEIAALMRGLDREAVDDLLEQRELRRPSEAERRSSAKSYVTELLQASNPVTAVSKRLRDHVASRAAAVVGSPDASAWKRLVVADGVELHVRTDRVSELDSGERGKVDRVLRFARGVFRPGGDGGR